MPTVKKTTFKNPKPNRKGGGVLDRIKPVQQPVGGMKICVYGRSKTGKTTLSATFPKPILLIGTEDGTRSISNVKGIDFVMLNASEELEELTELLMGGKYKTVTIDTAGGLQDLIVKEVLDLDEIPVQRTYGMGSGKFKDGRQMWGTVGLQWKERMRRILDLSTSIGLNVVVIAHERNFNDEGGSDLLFPTVGAALTPSAAGWLNGACDYICQAMIREETKEKKVSVGNKVITKHIATGKVEYGLRIGPHPVYMTGFRCLVKGTNLPDVITDPSFDKIAKLVRGGN